MAEMPVALYRTPVTPGALVVLSRLWAFVSASGPRWAHPTAARLQDELGLPNGTLYRHLRALTDAGVITRARGVSVSGKSVLGWTLAEAPPAADSSHARETDDLPGLGDETSQPRETGDPTTLPAAGDIDSQDWHSDSPTAGNRLPTGSSHMKLPHASDRVGGSIGWTDPSKAERHTRADGIRTRESDARKAQGLVERIETLRGELRRDLQADIPSPTIGGGRAIVGIQDALRDCNGDEDELLAVVRHAGERLAAGQIERDWFRRMFTHGLFGRRRDDWLAARGEADDRAAKSAATREYIRQTLAGER